MSDWAVYVTYRVEPCADGKYWCYVYAMPCTSMWEMCGDRHAQAYGKRARAQWAWAPRVENPTNITHVEMKTLWYKRNITIGERLHEDIWAKLQTLMLLKPDTAVQGMGVHLASGAVVLFMRLTKQERDKLSRGEAI